MDDMARFPDDGTRDIGRARYGSGFTQREVDIIELKIEGLTNKEIAHRLGIQEQTVKNHTTFLLNRAAAPSMVALVARYVTWKIAGGAPLVANPSDVHEIRRRLDALERVVFDG